MSKERKQSTEAAARDIRHRTRRNFSPEEKIRAGFLTGEQAHGVGWPLAPSLTSPPGTGWSGAPAQS